MPKKKNDAIFIAGIYTVFGILWILFTDWFILQFDPGLGSFAYFSTIKGLIFVVISGVFIWLAITLQQYHRERVSEHLHEQIQSGKKIEKTLRKQKDLLIASIEQSPMPIMLHSENKQILAISHSFTEKTGYRLQDIPTIRAWVENAYPYNHDEHYEHLTQLYNIKGKIYEGEYQIQTKDGDFIHWSFHSAFLGRDDKGLKNIITTGIDITDQKTKEKELTHKSFHDDLTGLYNRRYYNEMLERFEKMRDIGIILADINGLKLVNDVFGHTRGDELLISFSQYLKKHMPKDSIIARLGGDEFIILLPDFKQYDLKEIGERIKADIAKHAGEIIPSAAIGYSERKPKEELTLTFKRAENMLYNDKIQEYNKQTDAIIESLVQTLFTKTDETKNHIDNLKRLAKPFYQALDLSKERQRELELLIELHDIGKVSIEADLFHTKDTLVDEQIKEIQRHSEIGYRIANALPRLKSVAYAILTHHENVDGSGYPFGIKNDEIPLSARIFRIIESYEVMTKDQIYKKAKPKAEALEELKTLAGKAYDQDLVDIFVDAQKKA